MEVGLSSSPTSATGPIVRVVLLVVPPALAEMVTTVGKSTAKVVTGTPVWFVPTSVIVGGRLATDGSELVRDTTVPLAGGLACT
jgi:hypothetical protein